MAGQQTYAGYIVVPAGDTLQGFIRHVGNVKSPVWVSFGSSGEESDFRLLGIGEVIAFSVEGEIYRRATVEVERSEYRTDKLYTLQDWILVTETVFLKQVISGSRELWLYVDPEGKRHFYIPSETGYELLYFKRYINAAKKVVSRQRYKQQLAKYLSDCPAVLDRLESLQYAESSLRNLYQYYFGCTGEAFSETRKSDPFRMEIGVLAGMTSSHLDFGGDYVDYLTVPTFSTSRDFSGGLFLDVLIPGANYAFTFHSAVLFTRFDTEAYFVRENNENWRVISETDFRYSYLKIINALQFTPSFSDVGIHLGFGLTNGFAMSEFHHRKETTIFHSDERVLEEPALGGTNPHELGYAYIAGIDYPPFRLTWMHEKSNGMSLVATLSSKIYRQYFTLGYTF